VRFASVYRHFQDVEAFHEEIQRLRSQRTVSEVVRDGKRGQKRDPAPNRDQLPLLPADATTTVSRPNRRMAASRTMGAASSSVPPLKPLHPATTTKIIARQPIALPFWFVNAGSCL